MRILHALTGAAGQPWTATRALRRLGYQADALRVGQSKYGYEADLEYHVRQLSDYSEILKSVVDDYDVFHFYFRSFYFATRSLAFPTGMDMLALRAAGKVVIMNFRGSEVRFHSVFDRVSPWSYVDEDPGGLTTKFPEPVQRRYVDFARSVANRLVVGDPELATYVPEASIVPRSIDLELWPHAGPVNRSRPLVVHAPSRRGVKGSEHVLEAVAALRSRGLDFRFQLVEGLSQEDARELYKRADIIVDQLRIGWYGVLAVEAMALGKAVVAYIREDIRADLEQMGGGVAPLAYADPSTIERVLGELILDPDERSRLSAAGRQFCEKHHDSQRVAEQLLSIYESELEDPRPVDLGGIITMIAAQQRQHEKQLRNRLLRYPRAFVRKVREEGLRAALVRTGQFIARRPPKTPPRPGPSGEESQSNG